MLEMKKKTIYYKKSTKMAQINQILDAWNEKKNILLQKIHKNGWIKSRMMVHIMTQLMLVF
jgi:hypothetical protein